MQTLNVADLRPTIIPKSDQLNAEQLRGGPITVHVIDVRSGTSDEQPISVHYEGEDGRPFKPCKTMRKVLLLGWGPDGREWAGKSMTLYNDPLVKFGGAEVGGIRISHMTDIDRDIQVSLTATKGKKALHTIKRMVVERGPTLPDVLAAIETVKGQKSLAAAEALIAKLQGSEQPVARRALDARLQALKAPASRPARDLAHYTTKLHAFTDQADADLLMDEARSDLSPADLAELDKAYTAKFGG